MDACMYNEVENMLKTLNICCTMEKIEHFRAICAKHTKKLCHFAQFGALELIDELIWSFIECSREFNNNSFVVKVKNPGKNISKISNTYSLTVTYTNNQKHILIDI